MVDAARTSTGATSEADDMSFQAVVICEHVSDDELQLNLKIGDIVTVLEDDESGWAGGYRLGNEDVTGWFPRHCVKACSPQLPAVAEEPSNVPPERAYAESRPISFGGGEVSAMMTSSDSPTRQIRTIATPQSAGQAREADSEVNKLKEKLAAANHELAAEKAVRSQLERDYQQQSRHADRQLQDLKVQLENATTSKKGVEEVLQKQEARLRRTEACNQELQTQIGALQTELAKKNALLETLQARSKEEDRMHRSEGDCALGSLEQQQQKEETQKNKERLPLAARSDVASVDVRPAASTPKSTHFERGRSGTWTSPDLSKGSTCDVPRRMLFSEAQQSNASEEEEAIRPGSVLAQIRQFENRSRSARSHTPTPQAVRTFTPKRSNWRQEEQASSMATSSSIGHACGTKSGSIVTAPSVDAQSVQRAPLEAQRARTCEIVAPPLDLALATEEMTDAPAFGLSPLARQGSNSSRA